MTPLTTLIFDFHLVISSLMTPSTIPTTTPSLVKTSLKKCRLLFYSYGVIGRVKVKNGNILLLSSLFVSSCMKESQKFIFSRNFPTLVACKNSESARKETLLLLPETPW